MCSVHEKGGRILKLKTLDQRGSPVGLHLSVHVNLRMEHREIWIASSPRIGASRRSGYSRN